jgi:beta-phosphoglucomutase
MEKKLKHQMLSKQNKFAEWTVLFDFDGVAVKSMEQHFDGWKKAFAEQGIEIKAEDFFPLEGQGIRAISTQLGERYGLHPDKIERVMERKVSYYNQLMTVEFYNYFFELLNHLQAQQITMGVVTGGIRSRVSKIVDERLKEFITCLVTVDDVQRGKPFPDSFLRAAELIGRKPERCIVVENAPLGIKGAKAAGMPVIAITTTLPASFLNEADVIVSDFKEVEDAIFSYIRKAD